MKSDDPRLEANLKTMEERAAKFNARMLAVMKGHMIIEQAMDGFLDASLFHADQLRGAKFTFNHKAQLCRALSLNEDKDKSWAVLRAINRLRNQIAHDLDDEKIGEKMEEVRKTYLALLTKRQAEGFAESPDHEIAQSACMHCAGFIATLTGEATARRAVIDKNWKPGT